MESIIITVENSLNGRRFCAQNIIDSEHIADSLLPEIMMREAVRLRTKLKLSMSPKFQPSSTEGVTIRALPLA